VTGLLIFFAIIELAISAWLTARYHRYGAPSSLAGRTHFALFTSVWTVVFTFLYGILFWHSAAGSVLTSIASHGILCVVCHAPPIALG
jgi:vacuolar-type H+-ATPase subunit I/STV1